MKKRHDRDRGYSLPELLVVLMVLAMICGIALPAISRMLARVHLAIYAQNIVQALQEQQDDAILIDRNRALKFVELPDEWMWVAYEDADLDGVRNDDIRDGIDRPVRGATRPRRAETGARIAMPAYGFDDPDTGDPVSPDASPVNFNQSTLCSFSPAGNGTPGSVYITAWGETALVRSSGSGGRIRVLFYDRRARKWVDHW